MADYYDVLRKAVDGLERNDPESRRAVYERARQTVLTRQPLLPQDEVDRHLDGVREAARRIEAELADPPVSRPAAQPQPVERDAPAEVGVMPVRRIAVVAAGVLVAVLVAGLAAYYLVARDPRMPQASRTERTVSIPSPVQAKREPAKREAEVAPDQASYVLRQQRVYYRTTHPVGSIVVSRNQRFLYVVQPNNVAIRYAIGIGRECENVAGLFRVTEKVGGAAAGTTPPAPAKAQFEVPALYFSASQAVHRAADPARVGQSSSDGCFQAWDRDIADLYNRIQLDDRVIVAN
jgi:lipoprotein-anchoring transpeptidase ErfK/SrfK